MFEELERESKANNSKNNGNAEVKLFPINGLKNEHLGQDIKSFAKFFLKLQLAIYGILGFILIILASRLEMGILIIMGILLAFALLFALSYFVFLIVSGFGALVEDVNNIKRKLK
jgi:hypothetical protein